MCGCGELTLLRLVLGQPALDRFAHRRVPLAALLAREDGRDEALQGAEQRLGVPLAREEPLDLPVLGRELGEERLLSA